MQRTSIDLCQDAVWRFQPDPAWEGEQAGYHTLEYEDVYWRHVQVPIDFDSCHPALETYEGAGWFRRAFTVPADWRERRITLHFEGVNYHAKVWVNGYEVGAHPDGFLPFNFPIDNVSFGNDILNFDGENLIAVRVDNIRRPGEVPGLQRGWRTFGGILREVSLMATDPLYLEHIATKALPVDGGGHLSVRARVHNTRATSAVADIMVFVRDVHQQVVAQANATPRLLAAGSGGLKQSAGLLQSAFTYELSCFVPDAQLWCLKQPYLYTVEVELRVAGEIVDTHILHIGFRSIEVKDGQLWFNGEPIYLTGFNRHEDSVRHNMCADEQTARSDLVAMVDAGANFVRLCHYPHHPAELKACDVLGIMVMAEIPLYWWDGLQEGEEACTQKLEAAKRQLQKLIKRDCNHPSIIFWSVSNETDETRPEVVAGNTELVKLAQQLDPTRLATHVSNHWQIDASRPSSPHFDMDDVISVNAYPSWEERINQRSAGVCRESDPVQSDPTEFWRTGLAKLHARYPDKPILVTEFGYTSFQGVMGGAFGEDTHAEVLEREFAGMDAPYVCGATVWCWADHPWPPATFAFCNHLGISPYGVLTRDRRYRRPYWTMHRLFHEKLGIPGKVPVSKSGPSAAGYAVTMIRTDLNTIPNIPFPEGFKIRSMRSTTPTGLDDAGLWVDIERDSEPYYPIGDSLFHNQFGTDPQATQWRCYIVTDDKERSVGTISAWYNQDFKANGQPPGIWGQIHWVAVRQTYWGRGIGKAMLSYALTRMAQWHDRAFLSTQTYRLPAIKLYLDFGFVPDLTPPGAVEAWYTVYEKLKHPALTRLLAVDRRR
ncbi:MAG: GNAT family N-acetyltransferase [Anaerolineae bacterium]|nr:GNAT family N-acetyltransferase [Anaerolineae bacterium]